MKIREEKRGWPGQVYGLETYLTAFGEIPDTSAERQGGRDGLGGGVCGGSASGVRDAGFACGSERIGVERAVRNQPADGPCMAAAVRGGGEGFRGSLAAAVAQSAASSGRDGSTDPWGARCA